MNSVVVVVDPLDFFVAHKHGVEELEVEREECEGLKFVEIAEFGGHCGHGEDEIFATDAKAVAEINAGFVGSNHAGREGSVGVVEADALGAFVYVEEVSDTMSGSAFIINPHLP